MILLGKRVTVSTATNKSHIGLTGEVVEDGRDTIRLRADDGSETLLVKHTITLTQDGAELEGKRLRGTHAARMKK